MQIIRPPSLALLALSLLGLLMPGGAAALWRRGAAPGAPAGPPAAWPAEAPALWRPGQPLLLLLLRPQDPGGPAGVAELRRLLPRAPAAPAVHVLVPLASGRASGPPRGLPEGWAESAAFRAAARLPGVTIHLDADGAAARRLGLSASDPTLLYDREGRLRFHGAVAPPRGHEGASAGARALLAALRESGAPTPAVDRAPR